MTATEDRDPKMDPQTGDIVERVMSTGATIRRQVIEVTAGRSVIYSHTRGTLKARRVMCYISTWREWCVKANVVSKGE